jgi:hypothetical protein
MHTDAKCSSKELGQWRFLVKRELFQLGIKSKYLPIFTKNLNTVSLMINFFLPRNTADCSANLPGSPNNPPRKEVDNLVRFMMEAMRPLLFDSEDCIVDLRVKSQFVADCSELAPGYSGYASFVLDGK